VKQVGRELGVRYLLEGGVRRSGNLIRVTAQLVEAETGKHICAERYDRDLADIFAVQDEITEAVTIAIAPAIAAAEQQRAIRKPPESLDAWAAYQRGLWHFDKVSAEDNALAQKFFQQAIDLDPTFAGGYRGLAMAYRQAAAVFQTRSPTEAHSSAESLARRAIALDGGDAEAHSTLAGEMLYSRGDYEGALAEAERALALSPNLAHAHATLAAALIFSGRPREGRVALERSVRLDPHNPMGRSNNLALGLYFSGEYEAAVEAAKRAIRSRSNGRCICPRAGACVSRDGPQGAELPAVLEVNGLGEFGCKVEPVYKGRKVTAVRLSWWAKTLDEKKATFRELRVSRIGRRARLLGTVETVAPELPRLPARVELPAKGYSSLIEAQFNSLRAKFPGIDVQEMERQFVEWNEAKGMTPDNYCGALFGFIKQKVGRDA